MECDIELLPPGTLPRFEMKAQLVRKLYGHDRRIMSNRSRPRVRRLPASPHSSPWTGAFGERRGHMSLIATVVFGVAGVAAAYYDYRSLQASHCTLAAFSPAFYLGLSGVLQHRLIITRAI